MRPLSLFEATTCLRYIDTAYRNDQRPYIVDNLGVLHVAISGTDSARDVLKDLDVRRVPFRYGGKVHAGFESVYRDVIREVLARAATATEVVVSGHSLGGAVAGMVALAVATEFPTMPIRVYTFGAPQAGNGRFKRLFKRRIPESLRVVNDHDPIPQSLSWFYRHLPRKLHLGPNGKRLPAMRSFGRRLVYWLGLVRDTKDHHVSGYESVVRQAMSRHLDIY
jgi:predicted lipase